MLRVFEGRWLPFACLVCTNLDDDVIMGRPRYAVLAFQLHGRDFIPVLCRLFCCTAGINSGVWSGELADSGTIVRFPYRWELLFLTVLPSTLSCSTLYQKRRAVGSQEASSGHWNQGHNVLQHAGPRKSREMRSVCDCRYIDCRLWGECFQGKNN